MSVMLYQRSLEIEQRLNDVLGLVRRGQYSTPKIAEEIGVSIPTISRALTALRERGHDIRAVRQGDEWRYVLGSESAQRRVNDVENVAKARRR
jgi:biotin operon repressor